MGIKNTYLVLNGKIILGPSLAAFNLLNVTLWDEYSCYMVPN